MMNEHKPPLFAHWSTWYWIVLGVMLVQVILFTWLTRSFA
jgi:hypothetical protein